MDNVKHNDIFDSLLGLWDSHEGDVGDVKSKPTTYEIRDKNFDKMYSVLMDDGYKITLEIKHCSDGDEMEITEIRGPKASGFFFAENYGLRASDFLYTPTEHKHFFETVKK